MSKVIIKIGEDSPRVDKSNIKEYNISGKPNVTIKLSDDHSVLFYDRNPFYVIITREDIIKSATSHIEDGQLLKANDKLLYHIKSYIFNHFENDFSTSVIYALKNSKNNALSKQ